MLRSLISAQRAGVCVVALACDLGRIIRGDGRASFPTPQWQGVVFACESIQAQQRLLIAVIATTRWSMRRGHVSHAGPSMPERTGQDIHLRSIYLPIQTALHLTSHQCHTLCIHSYIHPALHLTLYTSIYPSTYLHKTHSHHSYSTIPSTAVPDRACVTSHTRLPLTCEMSQRLAYPVNPCSASGPQQTTIAELSTVEFFSRNMYRCIHVPTYQRLFSCGCSARAECTSA